MAVHPPISILESIRLRIYTPVTVKARWRILLQTSIGVLYIEGASLDPPYISILESRKASDLNACYREGTVADLGIQEASDLNA